MRLRSPDDPDGLKERVRRALAARWPAVAVRSVTELAGGASSRTFLAGLSAGPGDDVVVKMAPPGLAPTRNRDVLRQAAILDLLHADGSLAVPEVFARDEGSPPDVPPFFVMAFVPGESVEPLHVPSLTVSVPDVQARALRAAQMLAALHQVDTSTIDEPAVLIEDEVRRWLRALETIGDSAAHEAAKLAQRLLTALPETHPPALCHGDWRLGNILCSGPAIAAVIDWEIWSLGDPRTDLAWFLTECDPEHPAALAGSATGMPPLADLRQHYERRLGSAVTDLSWFRALAAFKQAAATALIAKHSAKRHVPTEDAAARINERLPTMFEWAHHFLDSGSTRRGAHVSLRSAQDRDAR